MGKLLGIDLGSVSLDAVVIDEKSGKKIFSTYTRTRGRARQKVKELLKILYKKFPEGFEYALVTGSGKEVVTEIAEVKGVNEIVAHGFASAQILKERGVEKTSIIEIGGQDSKYIIIDQKGPIDYVMNELCAAGTGAFIDVQADRLNIPIKEFAEMAYRTENAPSTTGRCRVKFYKNPSAVS